MHSILPLSEESAGQIALLEQVCFTDPWSEQMIRDAFSYPNALIFGIFDGDTLAGYYFSSYVLDEAELMNICILPAYRRRGLGTALLSHLKQELAQKNVQALFLEVRAGNTGAQALYANMGFQKVGCRKGYYENNGEDAVLMRCIL